MFEKLVTVKTLIVTSSISVIISDLLLADERKRLVSHITDIMMENIL